MLSAGQVDGAGNLLILGPPLAITEEEVDPDVAVLDDAIGEATR